MTRRVRLPSAFRTRQCPSCSRLITPSIRTLTTTTSRAVPNATSLTPPESPRYLPVPQTVQATQVPSPRIRGVMPVPRNILDRRNEKGQRRFSRDLFWTTIKNQTRKPRRQASTTDQTRLSSDPQAGRNEWKRRLADYRRQNLLQGLREMKVRRKKRLEIDVKKSEQRTAKRQALRAEREARQDEELTNPTTTLAMQRRAKGRIPDPNRQVRVAEMKARVQEIQARQAADRQDALHTLYMHARDFITTEEQLDAAIDKAFGTLEEPRQWGHNGVSIWSKKTPENIQEMLNRANRTRHSLEDQQGFAELTNKRIKRIAEELTGGKM